MPREPRAPAQGVFPAIRYDDAPAAIRWLAEAFGFEEHLVVPANEQRIAHAELSCESGIVMLGSTQPNVADQGIYVAVDDVDAHYERARAAGAAIVRELQTTDHGREYVARDLEGREWGFGTYRPSGGDPQP